MIEWLKKVSLFSHLNDDQLSHILRVSSRRSIPAGTVLFHEKEPGSTFYIVLTGSIKIFTRSSGGAEKVISVMNAGDSFGELSLIDGRPRSASAQTLEDTTVLELSSQAFMNLLQEHFDITRGIMVELSNRLRQTNDQLRDLTFLDGRTRVLKNLILLANRSGIRDGEIISVHLALNYDELAQLAGVTKQVLAEVLRELEQRGILQFGFNEYRLNLAKIRS
jgi:CRP-like cAMP-binding protein